MKQMRSRFRLLTLLLVCAFFLSFVLCAGSVLRMTGFSMDPRSWLQAAGVSVSPDPSPAPDVPESPEPFPVSPGPPSAENDIPGTDNTPDSEYNIFGL